MKVALARTLGGWTPADDEAIRASRRWEPGEIAVVDLKKPRIYKSLKRYHKLTSVVFENSSQFKSKRQVEDFLKLRCGHCTQIVSKSTGLIYELPDSVDYDNVDSEEEFQEIWQRMKDVVCQEILPGVTDAQLEFEILKLCQLAGGSR